MRRLSATKIITLGAMATALTVLSLYAASVLPTGRLTLYFISSVFVYVLAAERAYLGAAISFAASAALALMLIPERTGAWAYVALLGHYGIFKTFIDSAIKDKLLALLIRLLYCNIMAGGAVALAVFVFGADVSALESLPFPVWAVVPLAQLAFLAFDFLYWVCQKIYDERLRSAISPKR